MQQVLCVGLTTHLAGLIEIAEAFQQTLGPGAMVPFEGSVQGIQSFSEITRKFTCLQGRQSVSGAGVIIFDSDQMKSNNVFYFQLLNSTAGFTFGAALFVALLYVVFLHFRHFWDNTSF